MPKKTFESAEEARAILITQVKDNQPSLLEQIELGCSIYKPTAVITDNVDKEHGRIEQRTYEIFESLPMLNKWQDEWPFLRKIIRATRLREEICIDEKPSITTSDYVFNGKLGPEKYAKCIREHWFIENKLHHLKDATCREDFTVKRVNPCIFSICIDFALNIMRINKEENIRKALYCNSMNFIRCFESYQESLALSEKALYTLYLS
ncbi:hypothetical protein FACS189449_11410 [Alphaproteobacteria bacterium]|nr:hypothetical protein FACS189449_11410 [Alphaproteobacteria bacterium]